MKTVLALALLVLAPAARAGGPSDLGGLLPPHYFRMGFNQLAGGSFWPLAGGLDGQQAGFVTPAIEHSAADGSLVIPGLSYNPLNLGYIGSTSNARDFLRGQVAFGPSVQAGDAVKKALRFACALLPQWDQPGTYGALRATLAPGDNGLYADVGVYEAVPINSFAHPSKIRPSVLLGATLNKRFGAAP